MPIEIRELIIKTTIVEKGQLDGKRNGFQANDIDKIKKEIVEYCLEKITDQIHKEKER